MNCCIDIDGRPVSFEVIGNASRGEDKVLYVDNTSPIEKMPWKNAGFSLIDLLTKTEVLMLKDKTTDLLRSIMENSGIEINGFFKLEHYHKYVKNDDAHQEIIEQTRELRFKDFCLDENIIADRLSSHLGKPIRARNEDLDREIIQLRISRPNSYDVNPPHRDSYLKFYEKVVNLWIPLVGCNSKSSLPVIPGSHLWAENSIVMTKPGTALIAGRKYRVPAIISSDHGMNFKRIIPNVGQAIVFTPYLIHGASFNNNDDITRMAYELRLYHRP